MLALKSAWEHRQAWHELSACPRLPLVLLWLRAAHDDAMGACIGNKAVVQDDIQPWGCSLTRVWSLGDAGYTMLAATVSAKSCGSWSTTPIWLRYLRSGLHGGGCHQAPLGVSWLQLAVGRPAAGGMLSTLSRRNAENPA